MKQEAPEKLFSAHRHQPLLAFVGMVFPAERDVAAGLTPVRVLRRTGEIRVEGLSRNAGSSNSFRPRKKTKLERELERRTYHDHDMLAFLEGEEHRMVETVLPQQYALRGRFRCYP